METFYCKCFINPVACVAGRRKGGKGSKRPRENWELTRFARCFFSFPSPSTPATQAINPVETRTVLFSTVCLPQRLHIYTRGTIGHWEVKSLGVDRSFPTLTHTWLTMSGMEVWGGGGGRVGGVRDRIYNSLPICKSKTRLALI